MGVIGLFAGGRHKPLVVSSLPSSANDFQPTLHRTSRTIQFVRDLRVIVAFGRAFGKLPDNPRETSKPQKEFLKRAVNGLAQEGKVVSVRLSLFAEMVKSKSWTTETLKDIGGIDGVGVSFLEESFQSRIANPIHRLHNAAAQRVLRVLLPDNGMDIKGQMQSRDMLMQASGYGARPKEFDDLIRILDSETRLITPTESDAESEARHYQLTHDYLVPILRDWLTQKQKQTRSGRAELRFAERTEMWRARPETRQLPTWWEFVNIGLFTNRDSWAETQQQMMRKAGLVHGARWGSGLVVLLMTALLVFQFVGSIRSRHLNERAQTAVATLSNSRGEAVPAAMRDLEQFPNEIVARTIVRRSENCTADEKLVLAYAMTRYDQGDIDYLIECIPNAPASEVTNIADALMSSQQESLQALWSAACSIPNEDWPMKSRFAMVAMHLGDTSLAQDMCQLRPDPVQRTIFIDQLPQWHGDCVRLAEVARSVKDPALRSGLCLGIGSIDFHDLTQGIKDEWQPILTQWYLNAGETGVHSAAEWILRRWNLNRPTLTISSQPEGDRQWHVNTQGITMLRIPAGSFPNRVNSLGNKFAKPQTVTLTRPFLVSDREVSVGQYRRAIDDNAISDDQRPYLNPWLETEKTRPRDSFWNGPDELVSPTDDHPAQNVCWIEAVMFCNWLSHKEGLNPSYERMGEMWSMPGGKYEKWQLIPNQNGYRLPTDAEWEYTCRASTTTTFNCGNEDQYVSDYAVLLGTRTETSATKLPNGWGLFDMHGNVYEWCEDWSGGFRLNKSPQLTDPRGPDRDPNGLLFKVIRGGHCGDGPGGVQSRQHMGAVNVWRGSNVGFRLARSLNP